MPVHLACQIYTVHFNDIVFMEDTEFHMQLFM
jgi:hypothetical protein